MTTVWIVHWDYYDDWGNCAVFDNESAAQQHAASLNAKGGRLGDAAVEEWPVLSEPPP
jgi:hypothetical protein